MMLLYGVDKGIEAYHTATSYLIVGSFTCHVIAQNSCHICPNSWRVGIKPADLISENVLVKVSWMYIIIFHKSGILCYYPACYHDKFFILSTSMKAAREYLISFQPQNVAAFWCRIPSFWILHVSIVFVAKVARKCVVKIRIVVFFIWNNHVIFLLLNDEKTSWLHATKSRKWQKRIFHFSFCQ